MSTLESYTTPTPLPYMPNFLRGVQEMVKEKGSVTKGVAEALTESNIAVNVHGGDVSDWRAEGQSVLFIGDHRQGIEWVPFAAVCGQNDRSDLGIVAKPFSIQARVRRALAVGTSDLTLPVIPGTLARDRTDVLNRDWLWRMRQYNNLPSLEEIKQLNSETLSDCSRLLANGCAVGIYPAGGVMDAVAKPWQMGVEKIIRQLSKEGQETTIIAPFRFDDFSKSALLYALHQRSRGKSSKPQEIVMRIGRQGTVAEVLGSDVEAYPIGTIAKELHSQFISAFAGHKK